MIAVASTSQRIFLSRRAGDATFVDRPSAASPIGKGKGGLPPRDPISFESASDLVLGARSGDDDSLRELIERYGSMPQELARKLRIPVSLRADATQEGMVGLLRAVRAYRPQSRVHFSEYSRLAVARQMNRFLRNALRHPAAGLTDVAVEDPEIGPDELISQLCDGLSARDAFVIRNRFGLNGASPKTLQAIADELGVTRQAVLWIQAKALERLRLKLANSGPA